MASLVHRRILSVVLITLLNNCNGNSVKPPINAACPSFNCGSNLILGYPFWQQGQQAVNFCGYRRFGVSCIDQIPMLNLSSHLYSSKQVNYSINSLVIAFLQVNGTDCPKVPHEATFKDSAFVNYTKDDKMVHFFYNCSLYPPTIQDMKCSRFGDKRSYVFLEGAIPEFDWERYCDDMVSVPLMGKAVDGVDTLVNGFGEALQDGFKLTWKPEESECEVCEGSGGYCGYQNWKFFCFYSNGSHSTSNHDTGEGSTKFEPSAVAIIGVPILGGLIIGSTIFHFIHKKRIEVHKPGFSQIPSSGKL